MPIYKYVSARMVFVLILYVFRIPICSLYVGAQILLSLRIHVYGCEVSYEYI